ncbi:MAG: tetratricopeptide repeat protein [Flavobacteriales bacterium]|nr:tetratricopeptide repeat protein [Flavobacteriales bacterium]
MKVILFILAILIGIPMFAQQKQSLLREGTKLYNDSSYSQAEIKYRKALEKDQDYFKSSFNLADAVYKQERYEEASSLFNALKDNASSKEDLAKVYHNLGNSLAKENKYEKAINAYKNSLRINPTDDETRYNLALTKKNKQKQEEQNKDQENKDQENKDQENKDQENKDQENKDQETKKKQDKISKEDAEKMLDAIQQKEKELQEKLQKKKVKGKKIKLLKDW